MMRFDPRIHQRRSIRLKEYDYSQPGAYFVTLVTKGRLNLFGEIIEGEMKVNQYGKIVQLTWKDLPRYYSYITLEAFIVMPNHVHAIVIIDADATSRGGSSQTGESIPVKSISGRLIKSEDGKTRPYDQRRHGLPEIIRALKSYSARRINQVRHLSGETVWQRNYYEHIIRNQRELGQIRLYIMENPRQWAQDQEKPQNRR
ncbi:MAG: transposase [Anaerolineales bacterium]